MRARPARRQEASGQAPLPPLAGSAQGRAYRRRLSWSKGIAMRLSVGPLTALGRPRARRPPRAHGASQRGGRHARQGGRHVHCGHRHHHGHRHGHPPRDDPQRGRRGGDLRRRQVGAAGKGQGRRPGAARLLRRGGGLPEEGGRGAGRPDRVRVRHAQRVQRDARRYATTRTAVVADVLGVDQENQMLSSRGPRGTSWT